MICTTNMRDIYYLKSFTTSILLFLVKAGFGRLLTSSDAEWCRLTASSLPIAAQAPLATINVDKVSSMGYSDILTTTLYGTANYRIASYGIKDGCNVNLNVYLNDHNQEHHPYLSQSPKCQRLIYHLWD